MGPGGGGSQGGEGCQAYVGGQDEGGTGSELKHRGKLREDRQGRRGGRTGERGEGPKPVQGNNPQVQPASGETTVPQGTPGLRGTIGHAYPSQGHSVAETGHSSSQWSHGSWGSCTSTLGPPLSGVFPLLLPHSYPSFRAHQPHTHGFLHHPSPVTHAEVMAR